MNVMFFEQLVGLIMASPKSEEFNTVLFVLEDLLLEVLHVLATPVIGASLDSKTSQHLGPVLRASLLRIEWNDAPSC